jgi:hypothetical protein
VYGRRPYKPHDLLFSVSPSGTSIVAAGNSALAYSPLPTIAGAAEEADRDGAIDQEARHGPMLLLSDPPLILVLSFATCVIVATVMRPARSPSAP